MCHAATLAPHVPDEQLNQILAFLLDGLDNKSTKHEIRQAFVHTLGFVRYIELTLLHQGGQAFAVCFCSGATDAIDELQCHCMPRHHEHRIFTASRIAHCSNGRLLRSSM